jgi:DNA-directed RNA polymerase sigma subunit (sigma70/sigma32)
MLRLREKKYTLDEIAALYGITRQRVYQIIGKTKRGKLSKHPHA